jgi:hypothetical protein
MIIYLVWAIILAVHRRSVIGPPPAPTDMAMDQPQFKMDENNDVVNPQDLAGDGMYPNDEAEL